MLKHEDRIIFLKEFTKELILQSKKEQEEIKIDFNQDKKNSEQEFEKIIRIPSYGKINSRDISEPSKFVQKTMPVAKIQLIRENKIYKPIPQNIKRLTREISNTPMPQTKVPEMPRQFNQFPKTIEPKIPSEFMPQPTNLPNNFDLGKINFLMKDPRVTIIECQGPGKLVIVKIYGKSSVTRISLSQEEIQEIIEKFSKESKIPIISGLFKAAIGNLIITAVVSDLVGSRFIITKISPSFVLEQMNKGY